MESITTDELKSAINDYLEKQKEHNPELKQANINDYMDLKEGRYAINLKITQA